MIKQNFLLDLFRQINGLVCNLYRPETKDQGVSVLSSQSRGGLGKPSAGSCASILFHNHSVSAADSPIGPRSAVSAIGVVILFTTSKNKKVQTKSGYLQMLACRAV